VDKFKKNNRVELPIGDRSGKNKGKQGIITKVTKGGMWQKGSDEQYTVYIVRLDNGKIVDVTEELLKEVKSA
jgi:hypothetical protein